MEEHNLQLKTTKTLRKQRMLSIIKNNYNKNKKMRCYDCRPSILSQQHMFFYMFSFTSRCLISIPWWSIITHLVYYFLSHLWRFIVEGEFLWIPNVTLVALQSSSLSCILGLAHLVTFQVQLTQFITQLHFSLTHLVTFQVQPTQLHFSLAHLVAFQVWITQLHFSSAHLVAFLFSSLSYILSLAYLVAFQV